MTNDTWADRALRETAQGRPTVLHYVLRAMLNRQLPKPPGFGPSCVISPDGYVLTNAINADGSLTVGFDLGHIIKLRDQFRALADVLKLEDAERRDLFRELRQWVKVDYRAILDQDDPLNRLN
jgi:predicted amidohydrolase